MQWYLSVLKNYVGFSGRARRKEYWMFTLINAIVGAIINVIQLILGLELPYLSMLYLLATFLPVLALAIRRLHDTDRSGAWALLFFVPFIGWLVLLVFFCTEGTSVQQSLRKRSEVWFKLILELGRYFAPFY
ncbi:cytochrome [Shigella sonnei]|nr:cytochrome [Shigella sonnei]SJD98353.1 cytochrome [Shigella sonnei]SJE01216.1 cytochrome [Shigella sonnei]SJE01930.1 cytochrome [Shigella sonnei]SJE69039.1 cytochrome [Shigella sonnei]